MPGTTPTYLMPYPLLTDTPDVPRDVKALADRVEAYLTAATAAAAAVTAAHKPLSFHATAGGVALPGGLAITTVGSVAVTGPAVTAGYLHAGTGANTMRVLKPCMVALTALFYIPNTGDRQGAIGVSPTTWWYVNNSTTGDRVCGTLNYVFTALTDITLSQRSSATASTTLTIDGYLIPMD